MLLTLNGPLCFVTTQMNPNQREQSSGHDPVGHLVRRGRGEDGARDWHRRPVPEAGFF